MERKKNDLVVRSVRLLNAYLPCYSSAVASVIIPILSNDVNVLGFSLSRIQNLSARKVCRLFMHSSPAAIPGVKPTVVLL